MTSQSNAVCFARRDYGPLHSRLAACLFDLALFVGLLMSGTAVTTLLRMSPQQRAIHDPIERRKALNQSLAPALKPIVLAWLAMIPIYHIGLRRSLRGGFGYRVFGLRLVSATGEVPNMRTMARRFLFACPTVLFFGAGYLACLRSQRKQAVHDLFTGTWAVRHRARPEGPAQLTYRTQFLGTYMLTFADLEPIAGPTGQHQSSPAGL